MSLPGKKEMTARSAVYLWLLPMAFLLAFFYLPLAAIFRASIFPTISAGPGLQAADWARLARVTGFTFWQALLSMLLTFLVGLPAAWMFARFTFPGRRILQSFLTLPFILPTVVAAAGFNALVGPRGWLNLALMSLFGLAQPPLQVLNTLAAILLAHVFYNTTVVIRLVGGAWLGLDLRLLQAGRVLGASPWRNFFHVTLPLLRPALLSAALLVFLFDFTSFGVVLLLGGPRFSTLEVEIYTQAIHRLNLPLAALLSAIQLGCTLLVTAVWNRIGSSASPFSARSTGVGLRKPRTIVEKLHVAATLLVIITLLFSPLVALSLRSLVRLEAARGDRSAVETGLTLDYYRELFINRRQSVFYVPPLQAVGNSLLYALAAMVIALGLGWLAALALRRPLPGRHWLDSLLMLPLGASAVTLGLGFLLVFNRPPLDVRSFPLLIPLAHTLVAMPFVVRTLQPALASLPPAYHQAAAVLGAPPLRAWWEVDWKILWRPVLSAAVFAFTISLGEFGATSFLARPEMPTMPIAIYRFLSQPGALNYGQAMAMSTLLLLVCAVSVVAVDRLGTMQAA